MKDASIGQRIIAFFIDRFVAGAFILLFLPMVFIIPGYLTDVMSIAIIGVVILALFILPELYFFFRDWLFDGRSIGKWIMGIQVVSSKKPCSVGRSILRNVVWWIPFSVIIEFFFIFYRNDYQRIGDLLADTRVIQAPRKKAKNRLASWLFLGGIGVLILLSYGVVFALSFSAPTSMSEVYLVPDNTLTQEELLTSLNVLQARFSDMGYQGEGVLYDDIMVLTLDGVPDDLLVASLLGVGTFQAMIGQEVLYTNDEGIASVCEGPWCKGIHPDYGCNAVEDGHECTFYFEVTLTDEATGHMAEVMAGLDVNSEGLLSEPINLYVDDYLYAALDMDEEIRNPVEPTIVVLGKGFGSSYEEAQEQALYQMNHLRTLLAHGSLPTGFLHDGTSIFGEQVSLP